MAHEGGILVSVTAAAWSRPLVGREPKRERENTKIDTRVGKEKDERGRRDFGRSPQASCERVWKRNGDEVQSRWRWWFGDGRGEVVMIGLPDDSDGS